MTVSYLLVEGQLDWVLYMVEVVQVEYVVRELEGAQREDREEV